MSAGLERAYSENLFKVLAWFLLLLLFFYYIQDVYIQQ